MDTLENKGQDKQKAVANVRASSATNTDFVLEKHIFSNVFEKDIQRVFIYKKTERLAKAVHLISPAFADSVSLKERLDGVAVGLIDAGTLASPAARTMLARELLTLSSILAVARSGGLLSNMNAELIAREAQLLLQEVAAYEEPRIALEEAPTLAQMMKSAAAPHPLAPKKSAPARRPSSIGHIKDNGLNVRQESILSVIKDKVRAQIKDISTRLPEVSEKTIQRELQALVEKGIVLKSGERRWSTYSLAGRAA
jgi:hypothetical protein